MLLPINRYKKLVKLTKNINTIFNLTSIYNHYYSCILNFKLNLNETFQWTLTTKSSNNETRLHELPVLFPPEVAERGRLEVSFCVYTCTALAYEDWEGVWYTRVCGGSPAWEVVLVAVVVVVVRLLSLATEKIYQVPRTACCLLHGEQSSVYIYLTRNSFWDLKVFFIFSWIGNKTKFMLWNSNIIIAVFITCLIVN